MILSWVIIVIIIINFKNLTCERGNIGGTMWISVDQCLFVDKNLGFSGDLL